MLQGIQWVLFDAVGTLIFPDPPVAEAYRMAGQRFGSQLQAVEIQHRFEAALRTNQTGGDSTSEDNERERWRKIVREVLYDVEGHEVDLFECLWQHFAEPRRWRTFDDVDALAELCKRGYRVGIASNFDSRLDGILCAHPLLAACETVFVSSSVGYAKPDGRFFRAVEKRLAVEPTQIALVGDDEVNDVQGALAAGWKAIRLNREGSLHAPGTIRSLRDLV